MQYHIENQSKEYAFLQKGTKLVIVDVDTKNSRVFMVVK